MNNQNQSNFILQNNNTYKLFLTNRAANYIKQLISNDSDMIGLRITVKKSGCAGLSYVFNKVIEKNFNFTDLIFEYKNGAKIFVPDDALPFIDGSELDYIQKELGYTFKFKNPKIHHLCGCGESFNM